MIFKMNQKYLIIGAICLIAILAIILITRRETYTHEDNEICGQYNCNSDSECLPGGYCNKNTGYCCMPPRSAQQCDARKQLLRSDLPSDTFLCLNSPLMNKAPWSSPDKLYIPVKWGGKCCPCPATNSWCLDNQ